jgi:hypothetical protein
MSTLKTKIYLRNDTAANWAAANAKLLANEGPGLVLGKGEIGIEIDTNLLKIGNGIDSWDKLEYANEIPDLDADNVYFEGNMKFTEAFGKYVPDASTGYVEVPSDGKSVEDLFLLAFQTAKDPTAEEVTQPTVANGASGQGNKEVGTEVTPSYSATFDAGTYPYGPATGVTVSAWEATIANTGEAAKTTQTGSFNKFVVTDGMSGYGKITVKATHSEGAKVNNNLGGEATDQSAKIASGTKTSTSGGYTGYRQWFYGYVGKGNAPKAIDDIDSDFIRKGGSSLNGKNMIGRGTSANFPGTISTTNMQQMFFAIPSTANKSKIVVENNTNGAPQTVVGPITKYVKGANDYVVTEDDGDNTTNGLAYDFFYVSNDNAEDGTITYKITVS